MTDHRADLARRLEGWREWGTAESEKQLAIDLLEAAAELRRPAAAEVEAMIDVIDQLATDRARPMQITEATVHRTWHGTEWIDLCHAIDDLRALLRRLSPAEKGWRLIESAPKTGEKIDVWCVWPDRGGVGVRLTDVCWRGDDLGWGWVNFYPEGKSGWEYLEQDGPTLPPWKPTHWRPLPATPSPPETKDS